MDALLTLDQAQAIPAIPAPEARPIASLRFEDRDEPYEGSPPHWVVDVRWEGVRVHRTDGTGFGVLQKDKALAERLVAAINAGAVFEPAEIRTDVSGQTYVSSGSRVMGRYLNADLKRLGY